MNGKGDKQRPLAVSQETWAKNWDATFQRRETFKAYVDYLRKCEFRGYRPDEGST